MAELEVSGLTVNVGQRQLLDDVSFSLSSGELVAVLGPNGAGKTTLLRGALGLLRASSGAVHLDGRDPRTLAAAERARRIAYLPQQRSLAWPLRVRDVVALGRFAYGGGNAGNDHEAVDQALAACALTSLAGRAVDTLSGGELARVHCARAFASRAPLLLADEPTAALDPRHQLSILELLRDFVRTGHGVLVVLHDLTLAARFADRLLWLKDGRIIADGPPSETLTAERIAAVYGVSASVTEGEVAFRGIL